MLRAILAVSADGFVCRNEQDDMKWTGSEDKRIFRALTDSHVVGAGSTTYHQLPPLPNRSVKCITRKANEHEDFMALGLFAQRYPNAWLIRGQKVLKSAILDDLVHVVVISRVSTILQEGQADEICPMLFDAKWYESFTTIQKDHFLQIWRRPI